MKKSLFTVTMLALATLSLGQLHAANIALSGTGIVGVNNFDDGSTGTPLNSGTPAPEKINDGDLITTIDTFAFTLTPYSYFGVTWGSAITDNITSVTFYNTTFAAGDGGPFGIAAGFNGPGGLEAATDLIVPEIQTWDGTTWTTVSAGVSQNYVNDLKLQPLNTTTPTTFTFSTPITGIEGIRVFGPGAGKNGNPFRFAGGTEFQVEATAVPEPSTYALLGFGALALVVLRRRSLKA